MVQNGDGSQGSTRGTNCIGRMASACTQSSRNRFLCVVLSVTLIIALTAPFLNVHVIYPQFENILIKSIEKDAVKLATFAMPPSLRQSRFSREMLTDQFYGLVYRVERDFGLLKVKVFTPQGEVIYSTKSSEIGTVNSNPYFEQKVAKGIPVSKIVSTGAVTLEGVIAKVDVVETYVPFMDKESFLGAFEIYFDITERKQLMDRVALYSSIVMAILSVILIACVVALISKEAEHQAAQARADQLKEDVDRITRHDLKTPIISILNGIFYLQRFTTPSEEQSGVLSDMQKAASRASEMINRSFELYRMETGAYEMTAVQVDGLAVVRHVVSDLSELAADNRTDIRLLCDDCDATDDKKLPFSGDEALFYSVMANLIKNAIEASPGGTVTVSASPAPSPRVVIANPGVVSEDIRETFFDKYATAGKSGGTGLGTYSARLMVRTMGGDITMSSSEEDGTTVTVDLHPAD